MSAKEPRIVAELGRPETPDETAARKAESSRVHRASQNTRNLIAALLVTVAVVAVIYFGVPRGTPPEPEPVDVSSSAAAAEDSLGRTVIVPEAPAEWRANSARVEDGVWRVVYAPASGFVRIAQGFDEADTWVSGELGGLAPTDSTTIDGITWDVYDMTRSSRDDNLTYALATTAGDDTVLIYGDLTAETAEKAATGLTDQIRALQEEQQ
ncbi:DUF4245 domain-containing protein [Microbacterium sp. W1N]|uniref:DUF4245 domain-containing protein n=1 Tax=Microbacterium festucae TaxID=2977531 RepID=UPI0021BFC10E|nr:DUF4245 domain-containing protein [Microbacterium festucae]MCT9820533.1 DUF4245 domain-containing protein [Microbacterium festucae]